MTAPKISILVPCYNVERFVRQCMESIMNQTFRDMEIIAINDGSTDGTLAILQEFAARDNRVTIIDKPNEGYGKSMNRGLDAARGEYIGIVESDDWVERDMFENLIKLADANNADIVKSNFWEYFATRNDTNILCPNIPTDDCGRVIAPRDNTAIFFSSAAIWSGVYRREFLQKHDIRFLESPGASYQDTAFNFKALAMADRVYLTDVPYLHYRCDNENSSVKSTGKIFCICDEWAEIVRYLTARDLYGAFAKLIPYVKLGNYTWNMGRLADSAREQFMVRFIAEYDAHIRAGEFSHIYCDDKTWYRVMSLVYPTSRAWRIKKAFFNIIRPVFKTRVTGGWRNYFVFGIRVGRHRIINRPL